MRDAGARAAQVCVLSAFALAQPLFDILSSNPEFFAARGSSSREIILFALALTFVPPGALLLLEAAAGRASPALGRGVHLLIVGSLAALLAAQALDRLSSTLVVAGAVTGGGVAALAVARVRFVGMTLTVLAPTPLVFLALFLFASPVTELVLVDDVEVRTAAVRARTPVVLVVFDELSTVSLLDHDGLVDARRYPTFAALARDSTWFRTATTIHPHTERAVPAILTGRIPGERSLPVFADHPRNLFTLLGAEYELDVIENLTHLCPTKLCKRGRRRPEPTIDVVRRRTESLLSDTGIVYLHLVLPDSLKTGLPPITETWGDFRGVDAERKPTAAPRARGEVCARKICDLLGLIRPARREKPPLYFLHSLLPHVPWQYLPSGQRYPSDRRILGIDEEGRWTDDDWLPILGYQRHLLQLGYTDRALGTLLRRLKSAGLYDRALVVVTADHGVSFEPGEPRRNATTENLENIAFVPLLVKLPGARSGRVVDGFARTIDILPTIADVLGIRLSWETDGRSLLSGALPRDGTVSIVTNRGQRVEATLSSLLRRRTAALRMQIALFGPGGFDRVYRAGPHAELVGRRFASLRLAPGAGARVELDGGTRLPPLGLQTELVRAYVTGTISGDAERARDLAVAVDGEIVAVARSHTSSGETGFGAMLRPEGIRRGGEIAVFAVRDREDGGVELEQLAGSAASYRLVRRGGEETIRSSAGTAVRIEPDALSGIVRVKIRPATVLFRGWAGDLADRRPVEAIVVIAGRSSVYAARPGGIEWGDIRKRYGIERAGFSFELPLELLPEKGRVLRIFAVRRGVASELGYGPHYPWRARG